MSEEKLQELMATLPDDAQVSLHAARARRRALASFDMDRPVRRGFFLAPAVAIAVLVIVMAAFLFTAKPPAPSAPVSVATTHPTAKQKRLRMKWVLNDGTRVLWTFQENRNL